MSSRLIACILFFLFSPLILFLFILHRLIDKQGPFIFKQKRIGKDMKPFWIYKIRTMVNDAEKMQDTLINFNEATGPVFKIRNDPRFTRLGKVLSYIGIDEIMQLVNIIKGEMTFVGPRPLPPHEVVKIPSKYKKRFTVLPGITSLWVIKGAHDLTFEQWMNLDVFYLDNRSFLTDFKICLKTIFFIVRNTLLLARKISL